jgi:hypothetical protein
MNARPYLFALLCFSTPLFAQGAEVDLRSTAKKGNSVWLVTVQKQEQVIEAGGQEMESGQTVTRTLNVTVLGEDGGNLLVETKIARIQGSAALPMGMGDVEFDSAAPAKAGEEADEDGMGGMGGMLKKAMMAGAGKSYRAKVSPYGKVLELLDGSAELIQSDADPMAGGSLSKSDLERFVESAFGRVPEKATAVGAKWQHVDNREDGRMPLEQTLELTLVKADADSYEVAATGTVTKPEAKADDKKGEEGDENAAMARDMMKNMKMSNGKFTGTQKVSRQDGFVLEASNVMSVDAEFTGQMEMKMSIKSTTTTKRTTEEAAMPKKAEEPKKDEGKQDAGK